LTKSIGVLVGDLEYQMNFLARFSSMESFNAESSFCNKLQIEPNGGWPLLEDQ